MKSSNILTQFQFFPFHLVTPSPWPILVGFSLLTITTGAVSYFHGYFLGGYILTLGFIITTFGMALWLRDVITEATIRACFNKDLFKKLKNRNMAIIKDKFQYFNLSNILNIFNFLLFKPIQNCFKKSD